MVTSDCEYNQYALSVSVNQTDATTAPNTTWRALGEAPVSSMEKTGDRPRISRHRRNTAAPTTRLCDRATRSGNSTARPKPRSFAGSDRSPKAKRKPIAPARNQSVATTHLPQDVPARESMAQVPIRIGPEVSTVAPRIRKTAGRKATVDNQSAHAIAKTGRRDFMCPNVRHER